MAATNPVSDWFEKELRSSPRPSESSSAHGSGRSTSTSLTEPEPEIPLPPQSRTLSEVLEVDKKTPDSHVPRDSRLIRLTGVHPFNSEAPLTALIEDGFLTSAELFYVRNHGAVPTIQDESVLDWELSIEGLVEQPMVLGLRQLMSEFENVTYPVTLVCAGNRRKEQNQVRKSKGFSWGPAGVSTALFTGVAMSDVIRRARPLKAAKYVYMEGADDLPNGNYGTIVKLSWVMDPERGIMLAHGMNGEPLRPDHGKPLRAVIPGQIGGRSVKWLKRLVMTDSPSDNWYHIYDNRVLPTSVSPDMAANNPRWWTDERYAIYDLNTNSVTASPAHGEELKLSESPEIYLARGYAYAGGGRRVSRVEISLDQGISWMLADISYGEDQYRGLDHTLYGGRLDMSRDTCLCWCLWDISLRTTELSGAKDILVRAMDEGMCLQPRDMYWNVMGMMNNPWFRVAIIRDGNCLRFEHPTQPALQPGGWMERVKKAGGNLTDGYWGESAPQTDDNGPVKPAVEEVKMTKESIMRSIAIEELREHDGKESPWFALNGEVYDGTSFLKEHPGGAQSIYSAAATDATDEFMAIHSETAKAMMVDYHIGTLDDTAKDALSADSTESSAPSEPRSNFLRPKAWSSAKLHSKEEISWDSRILTFQLGHPEQSLGLPTGQHLLIRLRDPASRQIMIKPYTPISNDVEKGFMRVLVKVYFASSSSTAGKMSTALDSLPIGHGVDFKGPVGKFEYLGRGQYTVQSTEGVASDFVMICGGSGITPIFQVFRAIMADDEDKTRCTVLNGNRLPQDILCKSDLDSLVRRGDGKGIVHYTLTKPDEGWEGLRGRINGELFSTHCKHTSKTMVLVCGPEAMERAMREYLKGEGWSDEQVIFF